MGTTTIAGAAHYLPDTVVTSKELEERLGHPEGWIAARVGIHERRATSPVEPTWVMGTHAARRALERANTQPEDVDLLIAHTTIPELEYPDIAWPLARDLGLSQRCMIMGVRFGCAGFIGGLNIAHQFLQTGAARRVLIVCTEHMHRPSIHYPVSAPLFGDGSAAAVLCQGESAGLLSAILGNLPTHAGQAVVVNAHLERSAWSLLGEGLAARSNDPLSSDGNASYWDGRDIFKHAVTCMSQSVTDVLHAAKLAREDIQHYLFHQANIKIVNSIARHLDLPAERIPTNIDYCGNLASATIPTLLSENLENGRIRPGDRVLMSAFGTGFTYGAAIVEI